MAYASINIVDVVRLRLEEGLPDIPIVLSRNRDNGAKWMTSRLATCEIQDMRTLFRNSRIILVQAHWKYSDHGC